MAIIQSDTFTQYSLNQCLQFWYFRENSMKNQINVIQKSYSYGSDKTLWTSNLTFPIQTWHRASVTINNGAQQSIIITAAYLGIF